jgi:hypothetical protein
MGSRQADAGLVPRSLGRHTDGRRLHRRPRLQQLADIESQIRKSAEAVTLTGGRRSALRRTAFLLTGRPSTSAASGTTASGDSSATSRWQRRAVIPLALDAAGGWLNINADMARGGRRIALPRRWCF